MYFSASQLTTFSDCGERYRLEKVEHVEESVPAWWNVGGNAIHATYRAVTEQRLDADAAEKAFLALLEEGIAEAKLLEPDTTLWRRGGRKSKAYPDKEEESWWRPNGVEMSRKFATVYDTPFLPGRVVEFEGAHLNEVEFLVDIGGHEVKGFIDAIVEVDGDYIPRDYKSGSRTPASALQLGIYAEAIRQRYHVEPSFGEYLMTRTMTPIPRSVAVYDVARLTHLFDMLAAAREHSIYIPNVGQLCGTCSVAPHCVYGPKEDA